MTSTKKSLGVDLAAWLLAGAQLASAPPATAILLTSVSALVLAAPAYAQVDDDEDEDDDDDDDIDDEDIIDDDIGTDSDDDTADDAGDDVEDDDQGSDDDVGGDVGGDDGPGDDDSSPGGDDDGPGGDDGGSGGDDDGPGGDDGGSGGDDDGPGGDDGGSGGDDDGPGGDDGGNSGGSDDDEDNGGSGSGRGNSNDDDEDAPGGAGVRGVSPSSGSSPRDPDERPDTRSGSSAGLVDDQGYPLANKDILAFDLGPTDLSTLEEVGFRLMDETRLKGLGTSLHRLRPPSGMSMPEAADAMRDSLPAAPFDYNHVFGLPASDKLEDEGRKVQKVGGKHSGDGAVVAMIDTLVDTKHPSLSSRKVVVKDFASSKNGRDTDHGTAVASIIVGFDPAADYRGIIPGATLLAANVFSVSKDGVPETDTKALLEALDWAASQGAGVINFSIAGPPSDILEAAVKRLSEKGHIITAAVGNDGPAAPPVFPATYSNVVGVTAVDIDGKIYRRAGRGKQVDIAAPGVKILAAGPNGTYGAVTGTSFATPVISALLSLQNPGPGKDASERAEAFTLEARDLGASGIDTTYGHGLVQVEIEEVN